jgi:hypothetical protein
MVKFSHFVTEWFRLFFKIIESILRMIPAVLGHILLLIPVLFIALVDIIYCLLLKAKKK